MTHTNAMRHHTCCGVMVKIIPCAQCKREEDKATVTIVRGVEGLAVYFNNQARIGPKPWGGGDVVHEWHLTDREVEEIVVALKRQPKKRKVKKVKLADDRLCAHDKRFDELCDKCLKVTIHPNLRIVAKVNA